MPTINTSLDNHMYYICEIIYQIPPFITYTCVYNSLKYTSDTLKTPTAMLSHLPPIPQSPASFDQVTRLSPKDTSAPLGYPDRRWPSISVSQVSAIQYLFACQISQRSMSCNMVKSGLTWSRVFHHRHLGRRVTAVTCLRWPTVRWHCSFGWRTYPENVSVPGLKTKSIGNEVIKWKHFPRYWPFVRGIHKGNPWVTGEVPSQRPVTPALCFLWFAPGRLSQQWRRRWDAITLIMTSL